MAEANYYQDGEVLDFTPAVALSAGDALQISDGRAAVATSAIAANTQGAVTVCGVFSFTKTSGVVLLDGGRAYWDYSANAVTYKKVNDRDFYLGRVVGDATSSSTTCYVNLNVDPKPTIDMLRDGALSVATGTAAAGGFGLPVNYGGSAALSLTATNEAQCVDMLSVDRVALNANPIAEFVVRLAGIGSTNAVDLSIGLANGTSTTDADAITESVFFHYDGHASDLSILAESDDGTTEVNATDTTIDFPAVGSAVANRMEFWLDGRDPSNVKYYINGAEVLAATSNLGNIAAATGPLGLLVHVEKASGTATFGPLYIDRAELRIMEQ